MAITFIPPRQYWNIFSEDLLRADQKTNRDGSSTFTLVYGDADSTINFSGPPAGQHFTVYAGGGNDTIYGGAESDHLYGGDGNDYVSGGAGDFLYGDGGDDIVTASRGAQLWGGAGNDTFQYRGFSQASAGLLTIHDFTPGEDVIDFYGPSQFGVPGTIANYQEHQFAAGSSLASIETAAALAFQADSTQRYFFATDGTDGYLMNARFSQLHTTITMKGLSSLDDFSWSDIV